MTLDECELIFENISRRVEAIQRRRHQWELDSSAVKELAKFCREKYPRFAGEFGNVGSKVLAFQDATRKVLMDGDLEPIERALAWMDAAISVHRTDRK